MKHVMNCTGYEMLLEDIVKAEGYYLYDSKGNRYMDFESGVWSISLGHGSKALQDAVTKQMDDIIHLGFRYSSQVVEAAAQDVLSTLGDFDGKCVFLCSGSEAVELAVKAAKHIIKDQKLLTFDRSYLSAYGLSGSKEDHNWYKLELEGCMNCNGKDDCSTCKIIDGLPFDKIGAFVFEPGNSSGLVLLPPKKLIKEITYRVKANNGLIIVDEVTTGIGRTGMWYGYQHYDIKPDIIALGKGIGNGYPVSVAVFEAQKADQLEKDGFKHSQSHQNDALGCAVVSEVIKQVREQHIIEASREKGQYLLQGLKDIAACTDVIKEVRGVGMMVAVVFSKTADKILKQTVDTLFSNGIIAGYNPRFNLIRFYPTLTVTKEDLDYLLKQLREAICK